MKGFGIVLFVMRINCLDMSRPIFRLSVVPYNDTRLNQASWQDENRY